MKKVLSILVLLMTFMVSGYAQDTYTVAGAVLGGTGSEDAGFFGTKWDATNTANDMAEAEGGVFVKKYENLDLSVCMIAFKVATNHAWSKDGSTDYPSDNYELMVSKAGKYDLTITFNPDGKKVDALLESKDSSPEINSMEIRGNFPGMNNWDAESAVEMTPVAGSTTQWRAVMENVVVEGKTYEYKAFANHATDGYQLPASGNKEFAFGTELYPAGTYNLTFTADTQEHTLTLTAQKVEDPEPSITSMEIRGTFPGMSWEADGAVAMIKSTETAWMVTVEDVVVEAKTYEFKAYANHETTGYQLPAADQGNASFEFGTEQYPAGKYNLKFIADTKWNRFECVPMAPTTPDADPEPEKTTFTATFKNSIGWENVYAYAWSGDGESVVKFNGDFPGVQLKKDETTGVYQYSVEAVKAPEKIIFSNGLKGEALQQTEDLVFENGKEYDKAAPVEPEKQTFTATFKNSIGWENVYAYAWSGDGESVVKFNGDFPGVQLKKDATTGVYQYSVEAVKAPEKIIFSNGAGEQTKDLVFENNAEYDMEASTPETPTVSKVEIRGGIAGDWQNKPISLELKLADTNVYYGELNAADFTEDFEFKMLVNGDAESETDKIWLGFKQMTLVDPHKWVTPTKEEKGSNLNFANSTSGYQTYYFKAKWTPSAVASEGWELEILEGKERTAPAPEFIVLGNNADIFGAAWDKTSTTNTMEFKDGKYYRQYNNVKPQEKDIELKVYNKTNNTWFGKGKDNVVFNMKAEGSFTVVLDVNADFTEGNVEVTGDNVVIPEPPVTEATWTVAGDNVELFGETWNPALTANDMVKGKDGLYKWEKTDATLAAGIVKFKVAKNHSWDYENYPEKDYELTIPENGKYTVTITFNPETKDIVATPTKTGEAIIPDAEITSVQMPGDWNWALVKGEDGVEPYLVLTKGENNTWTGVLDLTDVTTDQKFKFVVNKKHWLGNGSALVIDAPEGWVDGETSDNYNYILKNGTTGYQTYNISATWKANANPEAGWTLTIAGKDERPVVTEPVYTLVGAFYDVDGKESASLFGEAWKVLEANNLDKIYEGFYKKEYTGIKLVKGNVSLKVLKDGDWDHAYPNKDGYLLEIPSAGIYDLTFTFHSEDGVVRGEPVKKADIVEIKRMDIVGDFTGGWPNTETGDWSMAKAMTQDASNPDIWTLKIEGFKAEAKTYEYKAAANGSWDGGYNLPAEGNNNWVFGTEAYPAGKYDLLFTANTAANTLTLVPTLKEVEVVILAEEETMAVDQVLEVDEAFTGGGEDEVEVEEGTIVVIEAHEADAPARNRASRALASDDITIQYKPTAGSDWTPAGVAVEVTETGYQFELDNELATAINERGFSIKANKPIVVTAISVVTEVTPEPDATISKVEIRGSFNDWASTGIELAKQGETNTYTGVLDLSEQIADQNIKLVINGEMYLNYDKMTVEAPEGWVEMSNDGYKNIYLKNSATGFKTYTMTAVWTPSPDAAAGWKLTIAGKDERGEMPDATISKVEIRGSFNDWANTGIELAKQGETNTYTGVLDLSELTTDQNIKLVINGEMYLNYDKMTVEAPEGWVEMSDETYKNIYLKNSATGFKTYTMTAVWTPSPDAAAGWKLTIAGKDERPAGPATITKVELRGEFSQWSDVGSVELAKQGDDNKYAGVLDLSEITTDQAFKLVVNGTSWIDFNHVELAAPDGWLVKETGTAAEPAIILTNASTGYKTYNVTATWTPSTDAAAGWKLEIAGKDQREPAPVANYYLAGSMTDWQTKEAYKLTVNEAAEAGVVEYMITINLTKDDQFKIAKSDDGIHVYDADWYPTGMENNYKITKTSNYTVYFRPNYDGGEGWHYGCIYAVDNNPTAIRMIGADLPKDAVIFDLYGRRITNPAKGGVYIVNGKKVVVK